MTRCESCGQENPDGFRFCGACGAALTAPEPPREARKTVTVLFCDVAGSTAMVERLDPETTRRVMTRYFDAMREAIERHGGTVEKFIGDAVMAVFGVPVVHEDDALRAVRAAAAMRDALAELNEELDRDRGVRIESRIGINTGEVVTGEGDSIATGDAVNVAARLEQLAEPGQTLLGVATHRLVRDAVTAEPVEALTAKGKTEPVAAFRLLGLVEGAEFIPRRLDSPLVGRENELAQLQRAYDHAVAERVVYQFTLLGPAGIGKSRLVRELQQRVDARLLMGRCLPYGEGITYWPLTEIPELATEIDFEANRDEIALQTRRILERLARERPLVVVFDDLQWAEPTFLELIDHVTDLGRDAPMLLICSARAELLDLRPDWGGGKLNATTMLLEALTDAESAQLVDNLLVAQVESAVKQKIAAAGEGNPLYLEEMLAMVGEGRNGEVAVPPTIQALLAARLDRLEPDERTAVECAAIQGQEFRHDALAALVPDALSGQLATIHQSLIRKDLIRPTGDETFRFKHLLLRDAAYDALPKEQRAELHERFAGWIETARPELAEIRGYHLEQAYRYRTELSPADDRAPQLAQRAATLLAAAGRRAFARADVPATINLYERAAKLLPEDDVDAVALLPDLAFAIFEGGDLQRAEELYRAAEGAEDEVTALRGRLGRLWLSLLRGRTQEEAVAPMEAVVADAERLGDESTLAEALGRFGVLAMWLGDNERAEELLRRSLRHAESVGDVRRKSEAVFWIALVLLWGQTPVEAALRECQKLSESIELNQMARSELQVVQGTLLALKGDFERGRQLGADGRQALLDRGRVVQYAATSQPASVLELLAGDAPAAERMLREAHDILVLAGESGYLSTVSSLLALALTKQQRFQEAESFADKGRRIGAKDDFITQIYWRVAMAQVAAAHGEPDAAARLASEVLGLVRAGSTFDRPIAVVELAGVLEPEARRAALEQALAAASAKGNLVTAQQAREMLAALP